MADDEDNEEEEMSFEDCRQFTLMLGEFDDDAPLVYGAFQNFLRGGCTEEQAAYWLHKHRDEFPVHMRESIDDMYDRVRYEQKVLEIITRGRSKKPASAKEKSDSNEQPRSEAEFMKRCEELHREGGVALQLPYMLKYGNLFR